MAGIATRSTGLELAAAGLDAHGNFNPPLQPLVAAPSTWARTFGGIANDGAISIAKTSDRGYVVAGGTNSFGAGGTDAWLIKLDEFGNVKWQRSNGGSGIEGLGQVIAAQDGGFVATGCLIDCPEHPPSAAWVFKLDASGNVVWNKSVGGNAGDTANGLIETVDAGYIIAAYSYSFQPNGPHMWFFKLDANGNMVWQKGIAGGGSDHPYRLSQTADGNFLVVGQTYLPSTRKFAGWLAKMDGSGNLLWQKRYGGMDLDAPSALIASADGGYIIAGTSWSYGLGNTDGWVFKIDEVGNVVWHRVIGGGGFEGLGAIVRAPEGGYVLVGTTTSFGVGGYDAWIFKMDDAGNLVWQKTYGGNGNDIASEVVNADGGGYVVAGSTSSFSAGSGDVWVLKLDANGSLGIVAGGCALATAPSATVISPTLTVVTTTYSTYDTNATLALSGASPAQTAAQVNTQCVTFNAYAPTLIK